MARERVYCESDPTWNVDARTSDDHRRPGVQVEFHRDGATVGLATGHLRDATYDEVDAATWPPAALVATPYHVWLTRRDVNELIRKLRRARDVAFGVDE